MRRCEVVHAAREGIEILAELGVLRVVPGFRQFGNAVQLHPAIELEMCRSPVFGCTAARLAVEPQNEIGLVLHLRPAVGMEHVFARGGKDVGDAVLVPEDFGFTGSEALRCNQERELDSGQQSVHGPFYSLP